MCYNTLRVLSCSGFIMSGSHMPCVSLGHVAMSFPASSNIEFSSAAAEETHTLGASFDSLLMSRSVCSSHLLPLVPVTYEVCSHSILGTLIISFSFSIKWSAFEEIMKCNFLFQNIQGVKVMLPVFAWVVLYFIATYKPWPVIRRGRANGCCRDEWLNG